MGDAFQFHGKGLFATPEKTQFTRDGRCKEESGSQNKMYWQTRMMIELNTTSRSKLLQIRPYDLNGGTNTF